MPYADAWAVLSAEERTQLESWRCGYYAQVTSIDENFGRLLTALDECGASSETIVVFASDHGEMFDAQGRRVKNIFCEEACHIPLLMRAPGRFPAGHVSDVCLGTVDLIADPAGTARDAGAGAGSRVPSSLRRDGELGGRV